MDIIDAIVFYLKFLKGWHRIELGFCPICNSDAPELYDCHFCSGRHSARGDKFPPSREIKDEWIEKYKMILRVQKNTKKRVRDSRLKRKLESKT